MKTYQKLTLALLTIVGVSSLSAAVLELDTTAGDATMAGVITGAAKKSGANTLTLSGNNSSTLTALEIDAGAVTIAVNNNLNSSGSVTFNGGNLNLAAAVTAIPAIVMTQAASIDLPELNATGLTIGAVSGSQDLSLVATGVEVDTSPSKPPVTMSGNAHIGAMGTIGALTAVSAHLGAASVLPASAACSFSGTLDIDNGGFTAGTSDVTANIVNANVSVTAAKFQSLLATKIVFGSATTFSQAVTAN